LINSVNTFAFIIHPLDVSDVARKYPVAKFLPPSMVESALKLLPPVVASKITGIKSATGATAEGWFVACALTSRQMLRLDQDYVMRKIIRAAQKAEELGAKIIGLGAFTSVVGDAGITVSRNVSVAVTTGNSYTAGAGIQALELAAQKMRIDVHSCKVAVIGATGSVGVACSHLLAEKVTDLTLVARDRNKLEALQSRLHDEYGIKASITTDVAEATRQSDLVVTASSAVEPLINPSDLKKGSVVLDIARPRDVSKKVALERDDVLVIEGGVIRVPGDNVDFHFNFGFPPGLAFACMAETMILALEGTYESFSLGREYSAERVRRICELADKHGFKLAGLRSFERPVSDEYIEAVRRKAGR